MIRKGQALFTIGAALYLLGLVALLLTSRPAGADLLRAVGVALCCLVVLCVAAMALIRWPVSRPRSAGEKVPPRPAARRYATERRTFSERRRATVPVAEERRLGIERRRSRTRGMPSLRS